MKKSLFILVFLLLISSSVFACTIVGVGRKATVDGSTIVAHTSDDSDVNPFNLILYPPVEAGSIKELYVNDHFIDLYNILESDPIRETDMYIGTYEYIKDTNKYLFAQSAIANDKGLTIGESTCDYNEKQLQVFEKYQGKWDLILLQELALQNTNTAKEAVMFMGDLINQDGWHGYPECMILGDGTDVWVFEAYGGKMWAAFRLPEDSIFVCSNRARIDFYTENDPENYLSAKNMKEFAIENDLWDGVGDFKPNQVFAIDGSESFSCVGREWRALCVLSNKYPQFLENEEYANTINPDEDFPLYFTSDNKISIQTIKDFFSDYNQGTQYDLSKTLEAGRYGNPLQGYKEYSKRPIDVIHTAYFHISSVKSWLPDETKCVVYYGTCAPIISYLTPVFPSQLSITPRLYEGSSAEYNENSSWWQMVVVQEAATTNFKESIKIIKEMRDPLLTTQYSYTEFIQILAAKLIENNQRDLAINLLNNYSKKQHDKWFDLYSDFPITLLSKAGYERISGKNREPAYPDLWYKYKDNLGNNFSLEELSKLY